MKMPAELEPSPLNSTVGETKRQALEQGVRRVAAMVGTLLFVAMFLTFCMKIVARRFGFDLYWTDDLAVILFLWMVFLSNSFLVTERQQIVFDLLYNRLQGKTRKFVLGLRMLLVLCIFAVSAPGAIDYIQFLNREVTSALQWRFDLIFSCFGIFMLAIIGRYSYRFQLLMRGQDDPRGQ